MQETHNGVRNFVNLYCSYISLLWLQKLSAGEQAQMTLLKDLQDNIKTNCFVKLGTGTVL